MRLPPVGAVHSVPMGRNYYYTHFTEEETEAQGDVIIIVEGCTAGVRAGILTLGEAWLL